jgi:peptidoglycan/LPS O-acetylase OafA/YrhL
MRALGAHLPVILSSQHLCAQQSTLFCFAAAAVLLIASPFLWKHGKKWMAQLKQKHKEARAARGYGRRKH